MPQVKSGNVGGSSYLQFGLVDTGGICTGQNAAPSNGNTSSLLRHYGWVGSGFNPVSPTSIEFNDADTVEGTMQFGGGHQGPFQISVDRMDSDAIALITGNAVDQTTNTLWSIFGPDPSNVNLPDLCLFMAQRMQSQESATKGLTRWMNWIVPVATLRYLPGSPAHQGKLTNIFEATPRKASKFPNGVAFGANQGWTNNESDILWIITDNPLSLTYFQGDGAATTFVTGWRPTSSVVTLNSAENWYTEDGVAEAPTSVVPATGVVTPDAAPAAAVQSVIIYETGFVAI